MLTLSDVIGTPERRKAVIDDSAVVLDEEVHSKGGISGLAVKGAFAMVKALKPGIIHEVIEGLLPEFADALQPILAGRRPGQSITALFEDRENDVVQALLGVTDLRAKKSTHKTLTTAYQKLRPTGEKHVAAALPRVARMIEKHVAIAEKQQAGAPAHA